MENCNLKFNTHFISVVSEDAVVKAEILQTLHVVDKSYSFSSCAYDLCRFKEMFPDSDIAKNSKQSETKIKYSIQFGIAPYVKRLIKEDIHGTFFCSKCDEATMSLIKKQYNGYTQ